MKTITITLDEQGHLEVTPLNCTLEDTMNMIANATLATMNAALSAVPTAEQPEFKDFLYEAYNTQASNVLNLFDPTAIPTHEMTPEQMLQKENELIERALKLSNRKTRRAYKR